MHNRNSIDLGIFHKIDINLYPLFIAIYEHKSISKAAQILCITQSAASHALQRLRQQLHDDLFVRTNNQMLPTPYAEQIFPNIKNALINIQNIAVEKHRFEPQMIQQLKIAIHDEIEPMILPKLVSHFQKLNLDIQFLSSKLDRKTLVADLATQQIDFVFDLERHIDDKVEFNALMQDQFVVCTQLEHLDQTQYLSSPHIGVSTRRTGMLFEDVYLTKKQISRHIFIRCQNYATAIQILEHYPNTILTIPKNVLSQLQVSSSLNIFAVPVDMPVLNMGMYWHRDLKLNSRHQFLKDEIIKIFA